jgi:hypothetical protein
VIILEGTCQNLIKHLKGQSDLSELAGVYKKDAHENDTRTGSDAFVQITALPNGYYLLVEGTGSTPDERPINGKASFVGFLPLGAEKDGVIPYLGVLRHDEPFFGHDAEGHRLDPYAEQFKCQFSLLLKGKGYIGYSSEFGIGGGQGEDWAALQAVMGLEGGKMEKKGNKLLMTDGWKKADSAPYVRIFQNPEFLKFLTFQGEPFWAAIPQADPVLIANVHYERGLAHFKNKAFTDALKEFDEGLR